LCYAFWDCSVVVAEAAAAVATEVEMAPQFLPLRKDR
jgi:hypothetical protein